jgi:hypothetical protein
LHATAGIIHPGQITATLTLSADADANLPQAAPLRVVGKAGAIERTANPEDRMALIALTPRPDIIMTAETREVTVSPGRTAEITVSIQRQGGFKGRVPVEVRNLPQYVRVLDVGLNGVLITEDETRRNFTIEALPMALPGEQTIYVAGQIETRSPQQNLFAAPEGITLRVTKPLKATNEHE